MTATELLPCPFCGGEAKLIKGRYSADSRADKQWQVYCTVCGASVSKWPDWEACNPYNSKGCDSLIEGRVIAAWNRRAED